MPAPRPRRSPALALAAALALAGVAPAASARPARFEPSVEFQTAGLRLDRQAGPYTPPQVGPHRGARGSTIVADAAGLLIAERNAGALLRVDTAGYRRGRLDLHPGLGEVVSDGAALAFVADRGADRVVQVQPGDRTGAGLAITGEVAIVEPHGLALTPDGKTLLVTSVADHQLIAVDVGALTIRWRLPLAPEPRGVAIRSDGAEATVGFLSSGALAIVDLRGEAPSLRWQALNPRDQIDISEDEDEWEGRFVRADLREARSRFQVPTSTGRRYARATFAVGYIGGDRLVAPHQVATPQLIQQPEDGGEDRYGGIEAIRPLVYRLALISRPGAAGAAAIAGDLSVHQPRALAYDLARDALFVGGYGDDRVIAIGDASMHSPRSRWVADIGGKGKDACGVDGLVVAGDRLFVHCELSRRVAWVSLADPDPRWTFGIELAASVRSPRVEQGAEIFRRGDDWDISTRGALACATCHPEGRNDGLTWRLGPSVLQTPMLAGRVRGTAPYKWDGQDRDLQTSFRHTVLRLGGFLFGLRDDEYTALQAFIESLPAPRGRADLDPAAVARGRDVFTSDALACDRCHAGDTLSDGSQHPFKGPLHAVDTPSLVGLGHSAPYYHDGSAGDLHALITDKGSVHDMVDRSDLTALTAQDAADLITYLSSL